MQTNDLDAVRFSAQGMAMAAWLFSAGNFILVGGIVIHGWLRPGYRAVRQYVCELIVGPGAWAQRVNFVVFGMLQLLFALLSVEALGDGAAARAGALLLALNGLSVMGSAVFPTERKPVSMMSRSELTHMAFAVAAFGFVPAAMLAFAAAFSRTDEMRWLQPYSVAAAVGTGGLLSFSLLPMTRDPLFLRSAQSLVQSIRNRPGRALGNSVLGLHSHLSQFVSRHAGLFERLDVGLFLAWELTVIWSFVALQRSA